MTNFQFLHPAFKPRLELAKGIEQLVHSDAHALCIRTCFSLERPVYCVHEQCR